VSGGLAGGREPHAGAPRFELLPGRGSLPGAFANYRLFDQDAVDWLRSFADESVDLIVTDPPYESLEKHRAIGTTTRLKHSKSSSNDWFQIFPNTRFPELMAEAYRVLARNRHFYLFCDQETMFVIKPIAESAGFKFWKPVVWDKCIGPDTLVRTHRGVTRAAEVVPGDHVFRPDGTPVCVLAHRETRAPAVRVAFSTGTTLLASRDHRFLLADGTQVEASSLVSGARIASGALEPRTVVDTVTLDDFFDDEDRVVETPDPTACLFCGRQFESTRAAAAHQARFCESARSKESMAEAIGVAPKRLRRWMNEGRLPAAWASQLGLSTLATGRSQIKLQNDLERWFPSELKLDYGWGKLVGLYAAEGYRTELNVQFALHREEKHLQNHIFRTIRSLGIVGTIADGPGNGVVVSAGSKILSRVIGHFVGGDKAVSKYFTPAVYAAPLEFQRGVFDGLIEGDGHWSREEQRETLGVASADLAAFALRFACHLGWKATMRRRENDHAGYWCVRFDPSSAAEPITVVSVEDAGETALVDIAIDDSEQLYQLHDGAITHNCKIGMGYHYRSRYEFILFFEKGKRRLADLSVPDVLTHPRIRNGYPTEKPAQISEILVRQSTNPGELVIDPFMGSGSVGAAALKHGRRFLGTDINPGAVQLSEERLGL
jgi:DNA modification methylase